MRSMRLRSGHFVAAMLLVACGGGAAATQLPKAPPQVAASPEAGPLAEAVEAAAAVEAAPPPVTTESCTADAAWLAGGTFKTASEGKTVTVQPFCLDRTEVTADAYAACVRAGQCTADHLTEASLQIH
jgi:formylglycine-generating enzyme required for sulfatase activity